MKYPLLAALLLLCGLISCKKSERADTDVDYSGQGIGRCRLSGFSDYLNGAPAGTIQVLYDASGRLSAVHYPSGGYNFSFHGDTIFASVTGICADRTDTIIHNGSHISMAAYGDQRAHRVVNYFYDAAGQLCKSRTNVLGAIQEDYFIWSGGDLVADSIVTDGAPEVVWRYEYYSDHADQAGNPGTVMFFLTNGMPLYRTRHLLKHVDYGYGNTYGYSYVFDADHKITRAYINGSQIPTDTSAFAYSYECP